VKNDDYLRQAIDKSGLSRRELYEQVYANPRMYAAFMAGKWAREPRQPRWWVPPVLAGTAIGLGAASIILAVHGGPSAAALLAIVLALLAITLSTALLWVWAP